MGLRFFKRIRLSPGLTVNLSRGGASLSLGRRGAHVTVGTSGARATVGATGTGLFYTTALGHHGRRLAAHRGHAEGSLLDMLVGLVIMWVFLRLCWALAWGPGG